MSEGRTTTVGGSEGFDDDEFKGCNAWFKESARSFQKRLTVGVALGIDLEEVDAN